MIGTPGPDRLVGTSGSDVLCGGGGNDILIGRGGNDRLIGGGGRDTLIGGSGRDTLAGKGGADTLRGNRGNDKLIGGSGADLLQGGNGSDLLRGGNGIDTVSYAEKTQRVTADLDGRRDDGVRGEGDRIVAAENLVGGSAADTLTGNSAPNVIAGNAGADVVRGLGGDDDLSGARGNDDLAGGGGADRLAGGPDNDTLFGGSGIDDIDGGGGKNYCDSTPGEATTSTCRYDWTGPEVVSLSTNAVSYVPGDEFVITAHLRDPAGVDSAGAMYRVGGVQNDFCGQRMTRVSGTPQDGYWEMRCTVPANVRNGSYTAVPYARDTLNNYTNTNGGVSSPVRASFGVSGGSDDSTGPEVVSLSTNAVSYVPGDEFVITAHLRDPAGVDSAGAMYRVGGVQNDFCGQRMTRVSGTPQDGYWEMRCTVPATARIGTYTAVPYARDTLNNYTNTNGGVSSPVRATFDIAE